MSLKAAAGLQIDPRAPILCTDFDPEPLFPRLPSARATALHGGRVRAPVTGASSAEPSSRG